MRLSSCDQRLPARLGIDLGAPAPRRARRAACRRSAARCAPRASVSSPREDQRQRAQQAALDLVRLGILGEAEHVAREIRDHAVRRHRGADARARADDRPPRSGAMPSRNVRTSVRLPTPASPTITIWRLRRVTSTSRHASRSALSSRSRPCSRLASRGARAAAARAPWGRAGGTRARA